VTLKYNLLTVFGFISSTIVQALLVAILKISHTRNAPHFKEIKISITLANYSINIAR